MERRAEKKSDVFTRESRRHSRFKKAVTFPVMTWIKRNSDFDYEGLAPGEDPGPAIIASNHASAYDFLFVFAAFQRRSLGYVASEHVLRARPWGALLNRYVGMIFHKKGAGASRTAARMLERLSYGESVYLAVEGEQTWDGAPLEIKPGTGKLAKKSGAALITYRIEGSYLLRPRWAKNLRRGRVHGKVVNVYTPEKLADMSAEEVDAAIARDLYFDVWKWQDEQSKANRYVPVKGGLAEGLEKALCSCPACRKIGNLSTAGDEIRCSCGYAARYTETGLFEPSDKVPAFAEWERLDEEAITAAAESCRKEGGELFSDEAATIYGIHKDHSDKELASGRLSIKYTDDAFRLTIGTEEFRMEELSNMSMVQADRLLFSVGKDYYEIRSDAANLRKYLMAEEILRNEGF